MLETMHAINDIRRRVEELWAKNLEVSQREGFTSAFVMNTDRADEACKLVQRLRFEFEVKNWVYNGKEWISG